VSALFIVYFSAHLAWHTKSIGRVIRDDRVGAWSVKDTLAHLTAWEQMMRGGYSTGLHGKAAVLPASRPPTQIVCAFLPEYD